MNNSLIKAVLITTFFFYPDNTPRSFRITSLARKFIENGYQVTLLTRYDCDKSLLPKELKDINIIGLSKRPLEVMALNSSPNDIGTGKRVVKNLKTFVRKLILYFIPDGHKLPYAFKLASRLKGLNLEDFQVIISNSNPFVVHLGTSMALRSKRYRGISIAETGDPYFYSQFKLAFYQKYIEKNVLKTFKYITVPLESAVDDYANFNLKDKVKVIPHGFYFDDIKLEPFNKSNVVRFAFAGRLYKDIRNPTSFLSFLESNCKNLNFEFHIYTDSKNKETMEILYPWSKVFDGKLVIHDLLSRDDCIKVLSQMDFLINFCNDTTNQSPSKIIDYVLSNRPFISISNAFLDLEKERFIKFLSSNYSDYIPQDISKYNINSVFKLFEEIINCA
ncbi:hypothetical protein [Shewanella algae]|uniref:hypothetical protein n=1 Tax=Shewanella algae TaxID=38313 RepID=UPI003004F1B4